MAGRMGLGSLGLAEAGAFLSSARLSQRSQGTGREAISRVPTMGWPWPRIFTCGIAI